MRKNEQGVAVVLEVLIALIVLGGIGFVGYRVMNSNKDKKEATSTTTPSTTAKSAEESAKKWTAGDYAVKGTYADADIIQISDTKWRLYYAIQPEVKPSNMEVYSATSTDGKTWTQESGARKTMATFPDVVKLKDGRYRMYFQGAGVLKSAISTDGLTFNDEAGTRIDKTNPDNLTLDNVAAPTVLTQKDGSFVMVYRATINTPYKASVPTPNQTTQLLMWATSTDGLSFTKKGIAVDTRNETLYGQLDGPDLVDWDGGSMRLFATSYLGVYATTFDGSKFGTPALEFAGEATKDNMGFHGSPPGDPSVGKINGTWYMYYGGPLSGSMFATAVAAKER